MQLTLKAIRSKHRDLLSLICAQRTVSKLGITTSLGRGKVTQIITMIIGVVTDEDEPIIVGCEKDTLVCLEAIKVMAEEMAEKVNRKSLEKISSIINQIKNPVPCS